MDQEKDADRFHDSESEDVYDLYNACNGVMDEDDLLDKRMLDELSPEELEALNVTRLKEIWEHMAAGCVECKGIISTLNAVRGRSKDTRKSIPKSHLER